MNAYGFWKRMMTAMDEEDTIDARVNGKGRLEFEMFSGMLVLGMIVGVFFKATPSYLWDSLLMTGGMLYLVWFVPTIAKWFVRLLVASGGIPFSRQRKKDHDETFAMEETFIDGCAGALEQLPEDRRDEYYHRLLLCLRYDHGWSKLEPTPSWWKAILLMLSVMVFAALGFALTFAFFYAR